jgi:hypothetical protein
VTAVTATAGSSKRKHVAATAASAASGRTRPAVAGETCAAATSATAAATHTATGGHGIARRRYQSRIAQSLTLKGMGFEMMVSGPVKIASASSTTVTATRPRMIRRIRPVRAVRSCQTAPATASAHSPSWYPR